MHTTGVDIAEIWRIREAIERFGDRFLHKVYTENEIRTSRGRVPELAARFAGKEAVMKLLGTGAKGVGWKEIEILPRRGGKPLVYLHGRAKMHADRIGLKDVAISLSHSIEYAVAMAVGEAENP